MEFALLVEKHNPSDSKHFSKALKALVWNLKNGKRGNLINRLERHKSNLELCLFGLSMYYPVYPSHLMS